MPKDSNANEIVKSEMKTNANLNKPHRAEIVGAGIGGLTTAAALAQRGWSVRVHERAPDLRAFGAGI
jgi:ribulose 1,5-bisphosphate synthetase/thiazole synthase